jgi:signal transduction histidine kinase
MDAGPRHAPEEYADGHHREVVRDRYRHPRDGGNEVRSKAAGKDSLAHGATFTNLSQRQQLQYVITHAQVTIFSVDKNRNLTLLEGAFIWDLEGDARLDESGNAKVAKGDHYIGKNINEILGSRSKKGRDNEIPVFLKPVEDILSGKATGSVHEDCIDNRWYRTRYVCVPSKKDPSKQDKEVDAVIGVSIDVTEIKEKEGSLRVQEKENTRLLANEAAAKEASRLKSQFLANMSHEIRTPVSPFPFP